MKIKDNIAREERQEMKEGRNRDVVGVDSHAVIFSAWVRSI